MKDEGKSKKQLIQELSEARKHIAQLEQHAAGFKRADKGFTEGDEETGKHSARIESVFDSSPVGLAIFDTDLRYVMINEALAALNGIPAQEHIGKTIREILPIIVDQAEPVLQRVLDTGEPITNVHISGSVPSQPEVLRHWNEHWFPLKDKDGQLIGASAVVEEVTDRKRMEEAEAKLRASQALLQAVMDHLPDAVFLKDSQSRIIMANPATLRVIGKSLDEVIGKDDSEHYANPDVGRAIMENDRRIMESGATEVVEEVGLTPDGYRTFLSTKSPWRDAEGRVIGLLGITRDITERKRVEESLRESEERFRVAQELSPDGFLIFRPLRDSVGAVTDFLWIYENDAAARMNDTSPKEVCGKRVSEVLPHHNESPFGKAYKEVAETGEVRVVEEAFYDQDTFRQQRWFRVVAVPTTGGDVAILVQNMTERKQAEESLREREERFRLIFENSAIGMTIADIEGHILQSNAAFSQMVGYTAEELKVTHYTTFTFPEDLAREKPLIEKMIAGKHTYYNIEKRYIHKDGRIIWAHLEGTLIRGMNGEPLFGITMIQDITNRKSAEEELLKYREKLEELVKERTVELKEKNKKLIEEISEREKAEDEKRKVETQLTQAQRIEALDRFAGGIAHDLNNILYPIIINTEVLLAEEPQGSMRHEILDQTLKAAHRQRDLVKKILSFSRRSERVLQPVQVRPLVEETITFLKSSLPSTISIRKNINVQTDAIMGDPIQIQQVVMNLCQNAADACASRKGTIEIGLATTQVEYMYAHHDVRAGEHLMLTVKDNGHGMTQELMSRIFEPFFTSKGVGKGTGMGLSVVHGIVKSHGGTITVESEEGKGSLFTVYFPLLKEYVQDQAAPPEKTSPVQGKGKILLVDDEEFILSSLQRALKSSGYDVAVYSDSGEAFREFAKKPYEFDLVVTDLTMPGMTGLDLTRKIQSMRPDIPIVLCTGYNDVISQEEAQSFGIKELLLKPVDAGELKKVIRRALVQ